MAAPRIFRYTDAGAPTMNGTVGTLVNVLTAVLVTGYGSVSGLGWTNPYSGTNRAVYRAPAGVQDYLDVNDNQPDASFLARVAYAVGYETMSAVGTGTIPFPTVAQVASQGAFRWEKSNINGAVPARPWLIIGDDRTIIFFGSTAVPASPQTWDMIVHFGEIYSHIPSDASRTLIATNPTYGPGSASVATTQTGTILSAMKRSYNGTASAWTEALGMVGSGSTTDPLRGVWPWPDNMRGALLANKMLVVERGTGSAPTALTAIRGRYRGLFQIAHGTFASAAPFRDQELLTGVGAYTGRTFMILNSGLSNSPTYMVETTAWETGS